LLRAPCNKEPAAVLEGWWWWCAAAVWEQEGVVWEEEEATWQRGVCARVHMLVVVAVAGGPPVLGVVCCWWGQGEHCWVTAHCPLQLCVLCAVFEAR
jgi:hypothetical protein